MGKQYDDWLTRRARKQMEPKHPANGFTKPELQGHSPIRVWTRSKPYHNWMEAQAVEHKLPVHISKETRRATGKRARNKARKQAVRKARLRERLIADAILQAQYDTTSSLLEPRE